MSTTRNVYLLTLVVDGEMQQCEIHASPAMMYNIYSALPAAFKLQSPHCGLRVAEDGRHFHEVEYAR